MVGGAIFPGAGFLFERANEGETIRSHTLQKDCLLFHVATR